MKQDMSILLLQGKCFFNMYILKFLQLRITFWKIIYVKTISSVQFSCSVVSKSLWPMYCRMPGLPVHPHCQSILRLMSIELVMPFIHFILCRPLLFLPSIFLSIRVFSKESALHIRWPKYWCFSFSISPSNEYVTMVIIKKSTNSKCWSGCGEKKTLLHCWWEYKLIQSL